MLFSSRQWCQREIERVGQLTCHQRREDWITTSQKRFSWKNNGQSIGIAIWQFGTASWCTNECMNQSWKKLQYCQSKCPTSASIFGLRVIFVSDNFLRATDSDTGTYCGAVCYRRWPFMMCFRSVVVSRLSMSITLYPFIPTRHFRVVVSFTMNSGLPLALW